jgi:predicted nucleic-acid-binding Zn-ribbon protein
MTENAGEEPRDPNPRSSRFTCLNCGGTSFRDREIRMNTGGMTFFGLDWLNKAARGYVCQTCGFVHMFAQVPS